MLCQNCRRNEATTHIKRIVNGSTAQHHLCSQCAQMLGYSDSFSGFGMGFGDIFGSLMREISVSSLSNRVLRCENCGCSFDDIVNSGKVGCANCYNVFYDKLLPSVQRIHGHKEHEGKIPLGAAVSEHKDGNGGGKDE